MVTWTDLRESINMVIKDFHNVTDDSITVVDPGFCGWMDGWSWSKVVFRSLLRNALFDVIASHQKSTIDPCSATSNSLTFQVAFFLNC